MNKLIIAFVLLFVPLLSQAQISTINIEEKQQQKKTPYDSLLNYVGNDVEKYIGQEFFLPPKPDENKDEGYLGFVHDYKKSFYKKSNIFKPNKNKQSDYTSLAGKYFTVNNVFERPDIQTHAFIKLTLNETNEELFYIYNKTDESKFQFLVVGYYEKHKALFLHKKVLIRPYANTVEDNYNIIAIDTGNELTLNTSEFVTCTDLTLDSKSMKPMLRLKNRNNKEFLFPLSMRHNKTCRILTRDEAETLLEKFGPEYWPGILDQRLEKGFSQEMVLFSRGEPDDINTSTMGEQWVYGKDFLFFEKGKLVRIDDR